MLGILITTMALYAFFMIVGERVDFYARYQEGVAWRTGAPLYQPHPSVNMHTPVVTLLVFAPLSRLPYTAAQILWTALNVIALAGAVRVIARTLALKPGQIVLVLSLLLLTHGMAQHWLLGQWTGLLLYPVTQAWAAYRSGRHVHAGVWLAPVIALKPPFALLALLLPWPTWLTAGALSAAASLVGMAATGLDPWTAWIQAGSSVDWLAPRFNASLWGVAARWQVGVDGAIRMSDLHIVSIALVVSAGVGLAVHALAQRDRDRRFFCAGLFSVLLSPLGWGYYLPLVAGPAIGIWTRSRLAWTAFGLTMGAVLNYTDLRFLTVPCVLCAWFAWTRSDALPGRAVS